MARTKTAKGEDAIQVERIRDGWRVQVKELADGGAGVVEVTSPHLDRGRVRATITVKAGKAIKFRDSVNLTSSRSRGTLLAKLKKKGLALDERVLVALDEACRTPP